MAGKHYGTPTTPNAKRHRKMGTITMSQEGWKELDRRREGTARGAFIEWLLDSTRPPWRPKKR